MTRTWRSTARLHRFEIVAVLLGTLGLTLLSLYGVKALTDLAVPEACFRTLDAEGTPGCEGVADFFALNASMASKGIGGMMFAPYLVGLILGVPLVGALVERRTAIFVWSIAPSRTRLFLAQLAFVIAVTLIAIVPPAIVADVLERVSFPQYRAEASFNDYGLRGLLPIAVAAAALALSVLTGAIVGRVLPGIIVAGALCAALFFVPALARPHLAPLDVLEPHLVDSDSMQLGAGWQRPGGRVLTLDEAAASSPYPVGSSEQQKWVQDNLRLVVLGYRPARYGEVSLRESLLLFGVAGISTLASIAVVRRRRPY
jgi:hypothetical protein